MMVVYLATAILTCEVESFIVGFTVESPVPVSAINAGCALIKLCTMNEAVHK